MAEPVSLVFAVYPTQIATVQLDVSLREVHSGEVELTDHPVESGANITDHSRVKPRGLTIDGVVSNTPINRTQAKRIADRTGLIFQSTSTSDQRQGVAGYAEAAYAKLEEILAKGDVITVVTQIRTYSDLVMTNLSIPRDAKTGDALSFSATFRQVIVVKNQTTTVKLSKEPKVQPKSKTGRQTPKSANDATTNESVLYKLDESTGKGLSKLLTPG